MMFSYGSGCAATMFLAHVRPGYKASKLSKLAPFKERLAARTKVTAEAFDKLMDQRQATYGNKNYAPTGDISGLTAGTFYLTGVDEMYRRHYAIKGEDSKLACLGSLQPQKTAKRLSVLDSHFLAKL